MSGELVVLPAPGAPWGCDRCRPDRLVAMKATDVVKRAEDWISFIDAVDDATEAERSAREIMLALLDLVGLESAGR